LSKNQERPQTRHTMIHGRRRSVNLFFQELLLDWPRYLGYTIVSTSHTLLKEN